MSPIEVLLIILLFIMFVGVVGVVSYSIETKRSLKKIRKLGEKNLRIHDEQEELFCCICHKPINIDNGDICYKNQWWCLPHWVESTSLEFEDNYEEQKINKK